MMNETWHEQPNMKWYLFVETDTYVLWTTLLRYVAALDHTRPYYLGVPLYIGGVEFGYGGAGFAVSHEALRRVVEHYTWHKQQWETFTDEQWAGDFVLAKAFRDAGAPLTHAYPIFQGEDSGVSPYEKNWCHPVVSYHHQSPDMIEDIWTFEQQWLARQDKVGPPFRPELSTRS